MAMHDSLWLHNMDLFEKGGGIPIDVFDKLTMKRITRIFKIQEQRLEERQKALDEQRRAQEAEAKRNARIKK